MRFPVRAGLFAALLSLATGTAALAQEYPNRPISLIVPFAAGGPTDVLARVLGQHMSRTLGQQIVIENITGAGGTIGASRVAKAAPDGYTMVMGNLGTHAASVGLYKNLSYDPQADFEPVMLIATTPMVLLVRKDLEVNSLVDFIALTKQRRLSMGSAGVGSIAHLTLLLFQSVAKVEVQHVPYRGLSQAANDLLGGQIDFLFDQIISATPHIKGGLVKPIVVTAAGPVSTFPNIPTAPQAGLPDLQTLAWTALFFPKGTPQAIVHRMNAAVDAAMRDATTARRLSELGADLPPPEQRSPQALGELVRSEVGKWVPLLRAANVEPN